MKTPAESGGTAVSALTANSCEGVVGEAEKKSINPELWQACAGSLVNLPPAGTHVVYFPQGHSEQVAASLKKDVDAHVPNYPNLPSMLLCLLHNVTLHADPDTDEVYAQMTLQPVPSVDKEALLRSDHALKSNEPQPEFFCKQLTASDTSTHGGFSVPRRAAEKIFPPLDFSMQPPAQELVARDLHDNVWTFRHIYRGQPKRHLLTTGWSLFVSGKRLIAGDSVLFIRDEKQQLLLGIRRANRQPTNLSSSVLSSDSMHIGILAAAAHAAANNSPFTVFYNPRASPSEFVIPLAKYYKAVYGNQISLGMRFRMMFETEDSGTRRYMGTITGISDLDPVRWKNSQWRNLQVGWDESTAGERRHRVSVWEIEPVTAPFFICPPPYYRTKRPRQPGMPDDETSDFGIFFKRSMPWLGDDICMKDTQAFPGLSLVEWMNVQQKPSLGNSLQSNYLHSLSGSVLQNLPGADLTRQLGLAASQIPQPNNIAFNNAQSLPQTSQQLGQFPKLPSPANPSGTSHQLQQVGDIALQTGQILVNSTLPTSQVQGQVLQRQSLGHNYNVHQQAPPIQTHQLQNGHPLQQHQQPIGVQTQQENMLQPHSTDPINQHLQMSDSQIKLQLLQKLQRQQQSLSAQQSPITQSGQLPQLQDQRRQILDVSQNFSRSLSNSQISEAPSTLPTLLPQANIIPQQILTTTNQSNVQVSYQSQPPGILPDMSGYVKLPSTTTIKQVSTTGSSIVTDNAKAGQSGISEEVPSCSTSPSTTNGQHALPPLMSSRTQRNTVIVDDIVQSDATILNSPTLEMMSSSNNFVKNLQQKPEVKPSLNISKGQHQGNHGPQTYMNSIATHADYLDTSSSTTSVCLSQSETLLQRNNNPMSYNSQSIFLEDNTQGVDIQVGTRTNIPFGNDIAGQLGISSNQNPLFTKGMEVLEKEFSNSLPPVGMLSNYDNSGDGRHELASPVVSQPFGVPDITFNSMDSAISDSTFLNRGTWAPPVPQFQRMRTYTKVYKRGAVGRSIDITRYSGYEELKQDLARRFGIEGQLEDRQRIGWKLVYVDHENDVLLVGDDPWEEFVNCVRCIKILSPQEVQQMSLDGDFGSGGIPHQACSSSDGGNA